MSTLRRSAAILLCFIGATFVAGCGGSTVEKNPLAAKIGRNCVVQFRRGDALGAGGGLPVGPMTGSINGAEVSLNGMLAEVGDAWIAITSAKREYVIPRESILLISFQE